MKQVMAICLLTALLTVLLCSCTQEPQTEEYIWPDFLLENLGVTAEEQVQQYENGGEKAVLLASGMIANEDGSVTVVVTPEQKDFQLQQIEDFLSQMVDKASEAGGILEISEDRTAYKFGITQDMVVSETSMIYGVVFSQSVLYQIFHGADPYTAKVHYTIYNLENDKVLAEGYTPGDAFTVNPEDWE